MNIVAIIPARYSSSRLPGKPLSIIEGMPMIWWVYNKVKSMNVFDDVVCAVDDQHVIDCCVKHKLKYVVTSDRHPNHISRIQEVSELISADFYFSINGDEPLITDNCIRPLVSRLNNLYDDNVIFKFDNHRLKNKSYVLCALRSIKNPPELTDPANIKVVTGECGKCLYLSRNPIPFPKGTLSFNYYKYVGVEAFSKSALDEFVKSAPSEIELIEDIDHIRFLDRSIPLYFEEVKSDSISVDTVKDLDYVRKIMSNRIKNKEIEYYMLKNILSSNDLVNQTINDLENIVSEQNDSKTISQTDIEQD